VSQLVTIIVVGAVSMAGGAMICLAMCAARTAGAARRPPRINRPDESVPRSLFRPHRP
jgi:hypothetical protein